MKKKIPHFSSIIVLTAIFLNVVFSIAMIWLYCRYESVPNVLITCWFSSFTLELISCAGIKVTKVKAAAASNEDEEKPQGDIGNDGEDDAEFDEEEIG